MICKENLRVKNFKLEKLLVQKLQFQCLMVQKMIGFLKEIEISKFRHSLAVDSIAWIFLQLQTKAVSRNPDRISDVRSAM